MSCAAIGIGGTGARCIEALVHLCAAGLGPKELFVLLVDPDSANGNVERTRRTILQYGDCCEALGDLRNECVPTFTTRIRFGKENEPEYLVWSPMDGTRLRHLGDLFQYDRQSMWQDLCRTFYSEFELKGLVWDRGFRGHASVSNPAMALVRDHLDRPPWADLVSFTQNSLAIGEHRTFLFASAFGATGAGAFPMIPRILRRVAAESKWEGRDRYGIGGALLLPYIMFESPHSEKEVHAEAKHFPMNTQAALLHYRRVWESGSPYDGVYFVGAQEPDLIDRSEVGGQFALGARDQRNPAHFVELLAGLAALDFYSREANYEPVGEIDRRCETFAAARASAKFVTWKDLPHAKVGSANATPRVQVHLTDYLTALSAFVDFLAPLMKSEGFEKQRRLSAWYTRHFKQGSLSGSEAAGGADTLTSFSRDFIFPWFWQLHKTSSNVPLHLLDMEFLEGRVDPGRARRTGERDTHSSRILHPTGGTVREGGRMDDVYTAIWDHMCTQPRPPSSATALGKLWYMVSLAAADYTAKRYRFETDSVTAGGQS